MPSAVSYAYRGPALVHRPYRRTVSSRIRVSTQRRCRLGGEDATGPWTLPSPAAESPTAQPWTLPSLALDFTIDTDLWWMCKINGLEELSAIGAKVSPRQAGQIFALT
jgi:hypothetical protein